MVVPIGILLIYIGFLGTLGKHTLEYMSHLRYTIMDGSYWSITMIGMNLNYRNIMGLKKTTL